MRGLRLRVKSRELLLAVLTEGRRQLEPVESVPSTCEQDRELCGSG